ncbi:hypothetical protein EVG20_g339 [Dentipellis fragilis]|uniref:SGNH hydrolase-type esterase domain-containing protein n=1 Tax=Dentipellis fragilis TaxID=205917 RepID=A0A4Y9ZFA7_9AGAM|nr:hypothetical protein EVG20_g339 [Dentipellis fragilis]
MSNILQVGTHWGGLDATKHLVIFGDSYSAVGYNPYAPLPTIDNSMGVAFPGKTYNEPDKPNWVGHLITTHLKDRTDILVYDYARGGDGVSDIRRQAVHQFIPHLGKRPELCPWTSSDTLFMTWVGINDCAYVDTEEETQGLIDTLFGFQEQLYEWKARNFLFINVPPINRSPAAMWAEAMQKHPTIYEIWNTTLDCRAKAFASSHPDATVMILSAWGTFSRVLDDPVACGFAQDSGRKAGGDIWFDRLHPTSAMHKIIADDIFEFLHSAHVGDTETKREDTTDTQ